MKITVITVCFNSAAHIADALRSVDEQSWRDIEHLVIDGGSTDGTLNIIEAHARAWRHVVSGPDRGIYDAMNKGLAMARGEVIGFINSDDFYACADALAGMAKVFENPSVDACWGDLCYVRQYRPDQVVRYWRSSAFAPGLFRRGWVPPHPTMFIRKHIYDAHGGFDISYRLAADFELMARMLEVHRVRARYLPEVVVNMRMGGATNRSLSNIVTQNREMWRALRTHGLRPSLVAFAGGKLLSRSRQYLSRPATKQVL
jgi:glycosyltransferase involved in cell wall biosynthesis